MIVCNCMIVWDCVDLCVLVGVIHVCASGIKYVCIVLSIHMYMCVCVILWGYTYVCIYISFKIRICVCVCV